MEKRIRELMESMQMSQQDFAKMLGISPGSLSSIFTGRTRPTNNHTLAIHKAFPNVNIDWLLFGEGDMYLKNDADKSEQASQPSPSLFSDTNAEGASSSVLPFSPSSVPAVSAQPLRRDAYAPMQHQGSYEKECRVNNIDKEPRKVKEIRVFYDDGTYETFVPSKQS